MKKIPMWRRYLRFFGPDTGADVQDELQFHIAAKTEQLMAQGFTGEEARWEAVRQFGDMKEVSELCRQIGEAEMRKAQRKDRLGEWWYDGRHALRRLWKEPRFSLLAIAMLAVGITGASCLFSVIDSWVIRAVRFRDAKELVFARSVDTRRGNGISASVADYEDLRERSRSFQSLAAWTSSSFTVSLDEVERVSGARVSPNFFATLGVEPVIGRRFGEEEAGRGKHQVAIVSHGFWKARLNGDAGAVGKPLLVDGERFVVVGVLPEKFQFTIAGRANIWIPLAPTVEERGRRQARFVDMVGRLKANVTVEGAREELRGLAAQLATAYPNTNADIGVYCTSLQEEIGRHTGETIILTTFGVTVGLLLLACSNVANLLLVRSLGRKRQVSIQMSLGASKGRIVRQALVETLAVFATAAGLGTAGGWWCTRLITALIPFENRGYLPDYGEATLNWTVVGFVVGVTLLTGIGFGLAPAFENARTNVLMVLKESGSSVSQSPRAKRLGAVFVTAQVILATVLLSSTAILVQGFRANWATPLGFESSGLLTYFVALDNRQYSDATKRRQFFESVQDAVGETQGLKTAVARYVPFAHDFGGTPLRTAEQAGADQRRLPMVGFNAVSPEYFPTLRTPMRLGRMFDTHDTTDAKAVGIVNEVLVSKLLKGNPIGQSVWLGRLNRSVEIVGVVSTIRYRPDDVRTPMAEVYVPFAQSAAGGAYLLMRAPMTRLGEIRKKMAALDASQPIYDAKMMDERVLEGVAPFQIVTGMLVWFGSVALLLAAIGVYGVVAYSVSQRTREIGIRAALGADKGKLLQMFLRQALWMLGAGVIPGMLASIAIARGLRSVLVENLPASQVEALVFSAIVVGSAILLAAVIPARKAAGIDPLRAIRYE